MREKILNILIENWHGSYNDCADDLIDIIDISEIFNRDLIDKIKKSPSDAHVRLLVKKEIQKKT